MYTHKHTQTHTFTHTHARMHTHHILLLDLTLWWFWEVLVKHWYVTCPYTVFLSDPYVTETSWKFYLQLSEKSTLLCWNAYTNFYSYSSCIKIDLFRLPILLPLFCFGFNDWNCSWYEEKSHCGFIYIALMNGHTEHFCI